MTGFQSPVEPLNFLHRGTDTRASRSRRQRPAEPAPWPPRSMWVTLANCESRMVNVRTGPYLSYLQWVPSTWTANGGTGMPYEHSLDEQIIVARRLWQKAGWTPWPGCAKKFGWL